ncbi:MAG: cation efflux family transporter, partial [Steroidobacteraceae bacterium]|nr:cation efflux family transporter [Steroidobacteraceae bacterium]
ALAGLVLAFIFVALATVTGHPIYDAIGSIVIGVILVCVSVFIAIRIKGLIVGRSAEEDLQEAIRADIAADENIAGLLNAITFQMGPDVLLALKLRMKPGITVEVAARHINSLELRIKAKFPEVKWLFVEPDVAD